MLALSRFLRRDMNKDLVEKYLRLKTNPHTYAYNRKAFAKYLEFAGDQFPPTAELIAGFIEYLRTIKNEKTGEPLSNTTIATYFVPIKSWCNWLRRTGVIDHDPLLGVNKPKRPRMKIPKAPEKTELDKIFLYLEAETEAALKSNSLSANWKQIRDLAIISFITGTGCRVSEVAKLRLPDLDLEHKVATIRQPKEGVDRDVRFSDRVRADLKIWLMVREKLVGQGICDYVFLSEKLTTGMNVWSIRRRIVYWSEAISGQKVRIRPHDLRHYYAINSIENGAPITDVQAQLGHSSLVTTGMYLLSSGKGRAERIEKTSPR